MIVTRARIAGQLAAGAVRHHRGRMGQGLIAVLAILGAFGSHDAPSVQSGGGAWDCGQVPLGRPFGSGSAPQPVFAWCI